MHRAHNFAMAGTGDLDNFGTETYSGDHNDDNAPPTGFYSQKSRDRLNMKYIRSHMFMFSDWSDAVELEAASRSTFFLRFCYVEQPYPINLNGEECHWTYPGKCQASLCFGRLFAGKAQQRWTAGTTSVELNELQESFNEVRHWEVIRRGNYLDPRGNLLCHKSTGHIHHPRNLPHAGALKAKAELRLILTCFKLMLSQRMVMEETPSAERLDSDLLAEAMRPDDGASLAKRTAWHRLHHGQPRWRLQVFLRGFLWCKCTFTRWLS